MSYRRMIVASVVTVAALAMVALIALQHFPAGTQLPYHWGADGGADRMTDAGTALFMPVFLCAAIALMMAALPRIEPVQNRMDQSASLLRTAWAALLALMVLIEGAVAAPAFGIVLPATLPVVGVGLLLVAIGNALPKSRPGFFVGIRTPWTLTDPDNWVATHRLGGKTMMAAGVVIAVTAALPIAPHVRAPIMMASIAFAVVPPILYSFLYWRRTQRRA